MSDATGIDIDERLQLLGWSRAEFARRLGISQNTLSHWLKHRQRTRLLLLALFGAIHSPDAQRVPPLTSIIVDAATFPDASHAVVVDGRLLPQRFASAGAAAAHLKELAR